MSDTLTWLRPQSILEQNHSGSDSELQVGIYVQAPSPQILWNLEGWSGGEGGSTDLDGNTSALKQVQQQQENNRHVSVLMSVFISSVSSCGV